MSKTITLFIVDRSSLNETELELVNDYLEKLIFKHIYWARKTHRIGVYTGQGTSEVEPVIPFQDATVSTWKSWKRITPLPGKESTPYDDIMSGVEHMGTYVKKLKFTKRLKWFGGDLPAFDQIDRALEARQIALVAVLPGGKDPFTDLEDQCSVDEIKTVAPVKLYEGPLTLGYPHDSQKLELAVKIFPHIRYNSPPTTHAVVTSATTGHTAAVKFGRDKVVDGNAVDGSKLERGYLYGSQIIPVNAELDETARSVNLGDPALEILGFVDPQPQAFIGESSVVQPNSLESHERIAPIVNALIETGTCALARFVKGGKYPSLQMCFLEPYYDENGSHVLLMTPVAMNQDKRSWSFRDLSDPAPGNEPDEALQQVMDRVVDEIDMGDEFAVDDLYVRNPKSRRLMNYMMDVFSDRPVKIDAPDMDVVGTALVPTEELAKELDLKQIVKSKVAREQEDIIAEEQELDLDELL